MKNEPFLFLYNGDEKMKLFIATSGKGGLDDTVSSLFGRASSFTIVYVEGMEIKDVKVIQNPYADGTGGVGIQVAQFAVNEKTNAVLAGSFGPNALPVLIQAGIETIQISNITVKEAITKYLNKELSTKQDNIPIPPVESAGMGMGRRKRHNKGQGRG